MSTARAQVTRLPSEAPVASEYLGPATVKHVRGGAVTVSLPGGAEAEARLALAYPYQPAIGDELLVIGRGSAHYVIGVLQGSGETALTFQGGVAIRAVGGPIAITSDEGVSVAGPDVSIDAGNLRMTAGSLVEKLGSFYQKVSALLSVRAREAETIVDGASITRAKSAAILTEETMSINGKQIHLG